MDDEAKMLHLDIAELARRNRRALTADAAGAAAPRTRPRGRKALSALPPTPVDNSGSRRLEQPAETTPTPATLGAHQAADTRKSATGPRARQRPSTVPAIISRRTSPPPASAASPTPI